MVSLFSCHSPFAPSVAAIRFFLVMYGPRFFLGVLLIFDLLCPLLISESVMREQLLETGSITVRTAYGILYACQTNLLIVLVESRVRS
jgi:hypothetical protein